MPLLLQGLELAVPGTYLIGEPVVTIAAFAPQLHVITSKQRPRKLTIHGSDGAEYMFLLKGHEDLRQVCPLFATDSDPCPEAGTAPSICFCSRSTRTCARALYSKCVLTPLALIPELKSHFGAAALI